MALQFEQVKGWVEAYGPAVVGLGSTLDNTGVPIFYVAGIAAAIGVKARASLGAIWVAAFLGSVVGDLTIYAIGRYRLTKDQLAAGFLGQGLGMGPALHAGERLVSKWGPVSIVFGRFVPYVGKVLPLLAGSYRMSWLAATSSIVVGSFLLTGLYFLMGEIAVDLVRERGDVVRYASMGALLLVVAALYFANEALKAKNARTTRPDEDEPIEL